MHGFTVILLANQMKEKVFARVYEGKPQSLAPLIYALGNERFLARIEKMTGIRRQAKPRGRPRLNPDTVDAAAEGQGVLSL